jgi:Ca-activated chloride channel family protein
LGEQQAEQLLNSAARDEREVQGKKQKQNRAEPPPGGKDW